MSAVNILQFDQAAELHTKNGGDDSWNEEAMLKILLDIPINPREKGFTNRVLIEAELLETKMENGPAWISAIAITSLYSPLKLSELAERWETIANLLHDIEAGPRKFISEQEYVEAAVQHIEHMLNNANLNPDKMLETQEGMALLNLLNNYNPAEILDVSKFLFASYQASM